MSKKTLALVAGLTVLTFVLVILALNTGQKAPSKPGSETASSPTPTVAAYTTVNLSPNPVTLTGGTATVEVMIDTSENQVTGTQFDLVYDPQVLTVGSIRQGEFYTPGIELLNNTKTPGRATYMIALTPSEMKNPKSGSGVVATFTVTRKSTAPATGSTDLMLENVYISSGQVGGKKEKRSVLKQSTGTTVTLSAGTGTPAASASSSGR